MNKDEIELHLRYICKYAVVHSLPYWLVSLFFHDIKKKHWEKAGLTKEQINKFCVDLVTLYYQKNICPLKAQIEL